MAWMYIFDEGDARCCKIGSAKEHYHDRFREQQPCNPRVLHLRAAIWFEDPADMKACERSWKTGSVRPKVDPGNPHREWYRVGWYEAAELSVWSDYNGQVRPVEPFRGTFKDDLNEGTRDRAGTEYHLMAYLLQESGYADVCKLRFTAYGWKGVAQHYRTGNPHRVDVYGRWVWPDNSAAAEAASGLTRAMCADVIHHGWYRRPPAEAAREIARFGGKPFPCVAGSDQPDLSTHWSAARFPLGDARVQRELDL